MKKDKAMQNIDTSSEELKPNKSKHFDIGYPNAENGVRVIYAEPELSEDAGIRPGGGTLAEDLNEADGARLGVDD